MELELFPRPEWDNLPREKTRMSAACITTGSNGETRMQMVGGEGS